MRARSLPTGLSLATLFAFAAACGSAGPRQPRPSGAGSSVIATSTGLLVRLESDDAAVRALIEADSSTVWAALPEVYQALGISGGVFDEPGLVYGNPRFTGRRIGDRPTGSYVRCAGVGGGLTAGGNYAVRLSIASTVKGQTDGRTLLATRVTGSAREVEGTSTEASRCVSNGDLEELITSLTGRIVARG